MNEEASLTNGVLTQLVLVRAEPPGQFTAQVVGLPDLRATAATRAEVISQVRTQLARWVAEGRLEVVTVAGPHPAIKYCGHVSPDDPAEKLYQEELARFRQEDLERTLAEYDQE